jgi:hypothetical protein
MLKGLRAWVRRLARTVGRELAYLVCESLDTHTSRRTTDAKCTAGNAIAVGVTLDWRVALQEPELPYQVRAALGEFSPDEWIEVMSIAGLSEALMRQDIGYEGADRLLRKPPQD